jgi:hypothetical protein
MAVCHLPFGPTAYFGVHNCVLRHDIGSKQEVGTISEVYPNLIFDNFSTKLGARFQTILKALFPVPKPSNKRIVTFSNRNDYISFRHATSALDLPCTTHNTTAKGSSRCRHSSLGVVQASCIHHARWPKEPESRGVRSTVRAAAVQSAVGNSVG